jgi:accessory secretory protein Asp1
MIYFIPAWYRKDQWCENEQFWYARRMHTEFDDTVKHIQLFHRSGDYPYRILLLVHMPNLRHFLHRQGVYHAPYWSCFDAMQEIRAHKHRVFSFHDIKWPEGVAFIYTPFAVVAQKNGEKFAQIEFGEDGNLMQIDMFENGRISRRNLYDDRGFVSSSIVYEEGSPVYQDYLMENGIWKFRCYEADGHVEINPNSPTYLLSAGETELEKNYAKSTYTDLEELIAEVFAEFIKLTDEKDIFCMAVHARHVRLVQNALKNRKLILSFFEDRYNLAADPQAAGLLEAADYMITDSPENSAKIVKMAGAKKTRVADITPYDSRVDFGISQQIPVQKILVPVDDLEVDVFEELIGQLCKCLAVNQHARVHLFTRQADYNRRANLEAQVRMWLIKLGYDERWCMDEIPAAAQENTVDEEENPVRRLFFVEQCVDELSVSRCMREQRLIVDVRKIPELYLQITSISMGIPQIVRTETAFVMDGKNGFILSDIRRLPECVSYFLDSLGNWNEALVYSYELGKNFTTEKLLEKWREVIDCVG